MILVIATALLFPLTLLLLVFGSIVGGFLGGPGGQQSGPPPARPRRVVTKTAAAPSPLAQQAARADLSRYRHQWAQEDRNVGAARADDDRRWRHTIMRAGDDNSPAAVRARRERRAAHADWAAQDKRDSAWRAGVAADLRARGGLGPLE